ncbi:fucolectin-4-like [Eleutherodactylus coqui]|uniref:fucolectin-4-like n=1 Tax=Eleutherodactylus coqui TaxID=57060 RepID=UPI003461FF09
MELLHSTALLCLLCTAAASSVLPIRNVALHGRSTQSSRFDWNSDAINAIDDNPDSNFFHGSCSSTSLDMSPWWRVDLLRPYRISHITITNRGDCCSEFLDGAKVLVGNSLENNGNNNAFCAGINSIPRGGTQTLQCNNLVGQYVNIIQPGKLTYLQLCEVQIFAVPDSNQALCI